MAIVLSVLLWQLTAFAIFVGHGHVANLDQILADDAFTHANIIHRDRFFAFASQTPQSAMLK
jgi:hypothetical protein